MTITIDLSPEEARLRANAARDGVEVEQWTKRRVLSAAGHADYADLTPDEGARKNAAAIAMLEQWLKEDATDDPEEIRQAQKIWTN